MLNPELKKETLRQSDERFRRMIEEIVDYAIILLNKDGIIQNWNRGAQRIKGYTPEEIIGKHFRLFYLPEDRAAKLPEHLLDEATRNGRAVLEGWRVRKDGTRFWGSIVITALHDDHDKVIGFSKITRDLTIAKRSDEQLKENIRQLEELRKSEERYHNMISEVQDYAILLLDKEGNILDWNRGAEKIKGYKASEIVGKNFRIFYRDEDRASGLPDRLLKEAADTGRAHHEGPRVRKNGQTFWGSIVITALHDTEGNLTGFSKVTRDLTDKKAAEDKLQQYANQLEQKNQELEEFTYIASHDLKEPLRKIIAFGDLLQSTCKDMDQKANSYITRMKDASKRMMSLIEDLLQFSRIGKVEQELEITDLNQVVDRVIQDLEPSIQDRNASITKVELPTLMARPLQMQQLFQNLISNAIKFNDKPVPAVHITNTLVPGDDPEDTHCRILVEDNGIGIGEEHKDRIFEAFQRLHGRLDYTGSGIGLAICKKIVELHHGTITVDSQEGKGSTFVITLPCNQPESI